MHERLFRARDRILLSIKDAESVIVVHRDSVRTILIDQHDSVFGGHAGIPQMLLNIRKLYYWPTMEHDVTNWVQSCDPCQKNKRSPNGWFELAPPVIASVWERVAMDFGDIEESAEGHVAFQVFVDTSSSYVDLYAVFDKTAESSLTAVVETVSHNGLMRQIVGDGGPEMENRLKQEFNINVGIVGHTVTPNAHHPNGSAERMVGEIRSFFRKFQCGNMWHRFVPMARYYLNSRRLERLNGLSPAELMTGRPMRSPLQLLAMGSEIAELQSPDWFEKRQINVENALEKLRKERQKTADQFAKKQSKGPHHRPIQKGDMIIYDKRDTSAGQKNRLPMDGPVEVLHSQHDGRRLTFMTPDGQKEQVIHAKFARRFNVRDEPITQEESAQIPTLLTPSKRARVQEIAQAEEIASIPIEPRLLDQPSPTKEGEYDIEQIIGARGKMGPNRQYRVVWSGYGDEENTWQPAKSLPCPMIEQAIQRFGFPDDLSDSIIHYRPDAKEILYVSGVGTIRTHHQGTVNTLVVTMTGEPVSDRTMKLSFELVPVELFDDDYADIWESEELRQRAYSIFQRLQRR